MADVIKAYWEFARPYYGDGVGPGAVGAIKSALKILRRTYGDTPAKDFGPLALQVVREHMVKAGWSRTYVNMQIGNLKRCFKWAASREPIPGSVFHGLQSVGGLRQGKCDARETDPVKPVSEEWVNATIERGRPSRQVAGLIRLQLASGMRPGEAVIMRGCDIDTTGEVWVYTPQRHKTQHHGHERAVFLGPQAQAVVREFLKPDTQAYLFSPADAEQERRDELHEGRTTPDSCGNNLGTNRRRRPRKAPGDRYTVASYYRATVRACDEAFPPPAELARAPSDRRTRCRWCGWLGGRWRGRRPARCPNRSRSSPGRRRPRGTAGRAPLHAHHRSGQRARFSPRSGKAQVQGYRRGVDRPPRSRRKVSRPTPGGTAVDARARAVGRNLKESCRIVPGLSVPTQDLYDGWVLWSQNQGTRKPTEAHVFGRDLGAAYPGIKRRLRRDGDERGYVYEGVDLTLAAREAVSTARAARNGQNAGPRLAQREMYA